MSGPTGSEVEQGWLFQSLPNTGCLVCLGARSCKRRWVEFHRDTRKLVLYQFDVDREKTDVQRLRKRYTLGHEAPPRRYLVEVDAMELHAGTRVQRSEGQRPQLLVLDGNKEWCFEIVADREKATGVRDRWFHVLNDSADTVDADDGDVIQS